MVGLVAWMPEISQYGFWHTEEHNGAWEHTEAHTTEEGYCQLRDILRKKLGVYVTRGIKIRSEAEMAFNQAAMRSGGFGNA